MKNLEILNNETKNLKEKKIMKSLKKLLSSVMVATLLAGSAVSLSCNAAPAPVQKQEIKVTVEQPQQPKKDPNPGERILKMNPYLKKEIDELYNPPCNEDPVYNCDKALTALNSLEKMMLKSKQYNKAQKDQIKEDIALLKQVVTFRKAKLKGSLTDSMKKKLREIENTLKNALCSMLPYVLGIGAISLIVGVCYLIGFGNIATFLLKSTKGLLGLGWGALKYMGKSCYQYFFESQSQNATSNTTSKGLFGLGWDALKNTGKSCYQYFFESQSQNTTSLASENASQYSNVTKIQPNSKMFK